MKKIIVSSDSLKPVLDRLEQAINPRNSGPTENIYFKVAKGEIELITTDGEITIGVRMQAETAGGPFEMLLPFAYLKDIVKLSKSCPISIELTGARKAMILAEEDEYEATLTKVDDFPELPSTPKRNLLKLDNDFVGYLGKALLTLYKGDDKPALTKACLDLGKSSTYLVSTDTTCIYKRKINLSSAEDDELLFSPKMYKAIEGLQDIELSWTQKLIALKSPNVTVWATRHEGKYVNYKAAYPKFEKNLPLNKEDFIHALQKSCLTSDQLKHTTLILKSEQGKILLETNDTQLGRKIKARSAGTYTGNVDAVSISAKKMLKSMAQVEGDNIYLHIEDRMQAILISSDDDEDYLGLIMPLKTDQ